jgi:hypothetical protein
MQGAHTRDPSTIASLTPGEARDAHYRRYLSSNRLAGSHLMRLRRPSRMPESSREYRAGDPVHLIDWKAFARTDQAIIREVRDEASGRVLIGLDLTQTMRWPEPHMPRAALPPTKYEVALRVALNVAHMHLSMGDLVTFWLLADASKAVPDLTIKLRSPSDVMGVFHRVAVEHFSVESLTKQCVQAPFDPRQHDVAFWVGDGLGDADVRRFLSHAQRGCFLHVLSSLELNIDWIEDNTAYFDAGTPTVALKEYQGQVLRQRDNYRKHMDAWLGKWDKRLAKAGGAHLTLSDQTPIGAFKQALTAFITERT